MSLIKASGIVRFFHRKHQCYIEGEGSFAGKYGELPKLDDSDEESGIARELNTATLRSRRTSRPVSSSPRASKLFLPMDIEQISEGGLCPVSPSLLDEESAASHTLSIPTTMSSLQRQPRVGSDEVRSKTISTLVDDVVTEDGETCVYSSCNCYMYRRGGSKN